MKALQNWIFPLFGLLCGIGLGLLYSWRLSPVSYVDADPSILRADFKDQYRIVIAAAYDATRDLPRARARLELLGGDPIGDLSAQAQRMLAGGEPNERVKPLAQLAADLRQGAASFPPENSAATKAPFVGIPFTPLPNIAATETPFFVEFTAGAELQPGDGPLSTPSFEQTPLSPQEFSTSTPRPTFTPTRSVDTPFILVSQDTICDPALPPGLMQFMLLDARRKQVPGIQIIVTWDKGEDRFFTGFKPEVGDGYADFMMQANTLYNIRIVEGGTFAPNISAPVCNGETPSLGGLLLTFQQP